jgi:hypothetical protein
MQSRRLEVNQVSDKVGAVGSRWLTSAADCGAQGIGSKVMTAGLTPI